MNRTAMSYKIRIFFRNIFILGIFFHLFNCMGHLPDQYPGALEEKQMLVAARDAFYNKSFLKAEELFKKLTGGALNSDVRRMALYGLACTRFVLAENDDELNQAFDYWYSWYKIPYENISGEDPRMMEPVFEKIITHRWTLDTLIEKTLTDEAPDTLNNTKYLQNGPENLVESPAEKELGYEKPLADKNQVPVTAVEASSPGIELQYLLESREKEILKLRQQLGSMEKNIKSLKNQIHAIEEIHQEIFEKKKGIRLR
jgi:hypothetical protein